MRRLFDDPQLSAALREDLQRSRAAGADYPTSEKLLQLRAALTDSARQPIEQARLQGSELAGRVAWRASHPGWKLVLILAVAGGSAVTWQWMMRAPGQATPRMAAEAIAPAPDLPADEPTPQAPAAAPAVPDPPRAVASQGGASVARMPAPSSSRREIAQLVRIRQLLERDPAAAYRLAQRSEAEFPSGLLSEERQALSILALAKTGARDEARRKANALFLRYPQSPMRELIEATLAR